MGFYSLSFLLAVMQRAWAEFIRGNTPDNSPMGTNDKGE